MSLAVFVRKLGGPEQLEFAEHDPDAPRASALQAHSSRLMGLRAPS